ncbi:hypothetical protein NV44_06855 [Listeria monocytogenes]|nr:hypothetical protein NV44_06855 [Listeria monocytogenes]
MCANDNANWHRYLLLKRGYNQTLILTQKLCQHFCIKQPPLLIEAVQGFCKRVLTEAERLNTLNA